MTQNLAVKNCLNELDQILIEKAREELLKRKVISIPFLMRKLQCSYPIASEVFAEVMGFNV